MVQKTSLAIIAAVAIVGMIVLYNGGSLTGNTVIAPGFSGGKAQASLQAQPMRDIVGCCQDLCGMLPGLDGDACMGSCLEVDADFDQDMFIPCFGDCDDTDPSINPSALEVCDDAIDNNCNGLVDCDDSSCDGDQACQPQVSCPCPYVGLSGVDGCFPLGGNPFPQPDSGIACIDFDTNFIYGVLTEFTLGFPTNTCIVQDANFAHPVFIEFEEGLSESELLACGAELEAAVI